MSRVHKALEALGPRDWLDVPQDGELKPFFEHVLEEAELAVASVPQPPGGSNFNESRISDKISRANSACNASELVASSARSPDPCIDDLDTLRKGWGKPVKLAAKDNPLGMTVWKMAGHDRHGAWFARRSVHEGLGFTKWKKAMQEEFAASLAVTGGPGAGSVRGIGADRILTKAEVQGAGQLEVYQLSAQFPGPVSPREFIACVLTSEKAFGAASNVTSEGLRKAPRQYTVVSIPVDYPEAPITDKLVRGTYESVEMIREIPLNPVKSTSTPDLLGQTIEKVGSDTHSEQTDVHGHSSNDPETNPVEWIMVTRSDPGGGIPRFMVERNTPSSIATDAVKFVDWAISDASVDIRHIHGKEDEAEQKGAEEMSPAVGRGSSSSAQDPTPSQRISGAFEPSMPGETGIIASLTSAVQMYAPTYVQQRLGLQIDEDSRSSNSESDSDDSIDSFQDPADWMTAHDGPRTPDAFDSESTTSMLPDDSSGIVEGSERTAERRHFEREIKKLKKRQKTLDERLEKARESEEKKLNGLKAQDEKNQEKTQIRIEKERKKQEERYKREMEKLERRKAKEEKRLEEKRQKARDKDSNARDRRERDEYRRRLELAQRENELLRRQVDDLQKENSRLMLRVGKSGDPNRQTSVKSKKRASSSDTKTESEESGKSRDPEQEDSSKMPGGFSGESAQTDVV